MARLLNAAVIVTGLLVLAPDCGWVLMHISVCAVLRLIQLRFGFKIKIAEHKNDSECGMSGPYICRHVCRRDRIGGFNFALCCLVLERGVHSCFFEAVMTCDQAHILKI